MQRLRRFIIHSKKRALWIGLALVSLLVVWSILLPVAQTGTAPDWTGFGPAISLPRYPHISVIGLVQPAKSHLMDLHDAPIDLSEADLSGTHLRKVDLSGAYLRGANLSGASLRAANLRGADLAGADLGRADLIEAQLTRAGLVEAHLASANLRGAYLRGADLRRAELRGADLTEPT